MPSREGVPGSEIDVTLEADAQFAKSTEVPNANT